MAKLGRYETLFWIASGGMADVYAGRRLGEAGFEKLVAIKQMRPHLAANEQFVKLFLDEARIAATVDSPHVVSTLDLDRHSEAGLFLVMDLVVGSPLSRLLSELQESEESMPVGVAVEIAAQASTGLHDAHEACDSMGEWMRIVHRDISPHNIMVGLDGRVRVTDFGVARAKERNVQTTTGMVRGKPAYFSPEQARGEAMDRRSDIFAMGVVTWEMLVGRPLFAATQPLLAMSKIVSEDIPLASDENPNVPVDVANIVAKALKRPLEERYEDAISFATDLREVAAKHGWRTKPKDVGAAVRAHGGSALTRITDGLTQIRRASIVMPDADADADADAESGAVPSEPPQGDTPHDVALRATMMAVEEDHEGAFPHTYSGRLPEGELAGNSPPQVRPGTLQGQPPPSTARTSDDTGSSQMNPISDVRRSLGRAVPRSSADDLRFTDGGTESTVQAPAPQGVVALVYTDLQSSSELWETHGDRFRDAMKLHDKILLTTMKQHGGYRAGREGDSFLFVFGSARDAVEFSLRGQEGLHHADWSALLAPEDTQPEAPVRGLKVRMGVHCGEVTTDTDPESAEVHYFGTTVVRTARLCQAAHGGQILLSKSVWDNLGAETGEYVIEDLGVHTLRGFSSPEHVRQILPKGLATRSFPRIRAREVRKTNLPVRLDTFVGRGEEMQQLSSLFEAGQRMVTVLGPGGTGKTRLSQQYGHKQLANYTGGVWFADLTEARTASEACLILAGELGTSLSGGDPVPQIGTMLQERGHLLLILDNFEQVVGEAESTVAKWYASAANADFLITSREKLQLRAEHVLPLAPLGTEEAVQLFKDRAQLVDPSFRVDDDNREIVTSIVERLDCSSLAIELAAARLAVLTPAQVHSRLSQRFKLLRGKTRDAHSRQATLRGAIDWSWDLLDAAERACWAQCAVFRGGFTLEAAEAVVDLDMLEDAPWVMDVLQSLHDKSLLRVYHPENAPRRFRMYESIREYGREKLSSQGAAFEGTGQEAELGDDEQPTGKVATRSVMLRHAAHYSRFGDPKTMAKLDQKGGLKRRNQLKMELDNLRLAVDIALTAGKPDHAAQAAYALAEIFMRNGPVSMAGDSCKDVLERATKDNPLSDASRAQLLRRRAGSLLFAGNQEEALEVAREAQEVAQSCNEWAAWASAASTIGIVLMEQSKITEARESMLAGLEAARKHGARLEEAMLLSNVGMLGFPPDSPYSARRCYEGSLPLFRELGNVRLEALTIGNLGYICLEENDLVAARAQCEEALVLTREMKDPRNACWLIGVLGQIGLYEGDYEGANKSLQEAVGISRELFWKASEGRLCGMLAEVQGRMGDLVAAETTLARAKRMLDDVGHKIELAIWTCRKGTLQALKGKTDSATVILCQVEEMLDDLEGDHPQLEVEKDRLSELIDEATGAA